MPERYRQSVAPVGVDVSLPSSGGAELGALLSRAARGVSDTVHGVASNLQKQRGAAAGEAEGLAGKPNPRKGMASLTAFGSAYNAAAEAAYSARIQTDISDTADRLAVEHEADPEGFIAAMHGFGAGLNDTIPEEYKPFVGALFNGKVTAHAAKLQMQLKARTDNEDLAGIVESLGSAASSAVELASVMPGEEGDVVLQAYSTEVDRRLKIAVDQGLMSSTDALKYRNEFHATVLAGVEDQHVNAEVAQLTAYERESTERAARYMAKIWAREDLTDEEKRKIQTGWEGAADDNHKVKSVLFREDLADVGMRLASGEATLGLAERIRRLADAGVITSEGMADKLAGVVRNAKEAADKAASAKAGAAGVWGDPANKDFREFVNAEYDKALADSNVAIGSKEANTLAVEMLKRTNVLPEAVSAFTRVRLMSGTPEEKSLAAVFYSTARDANPLAFQWTGEDPKLDSLAVQIAEVAGTLGDNGNIADMVQRIHDNVYKVSPDKRDLLTKQVQDGKLIEGNVAALVKAFDEGPQNTSFLKGIGVGTGMKIPVGAQAEYNRIFNLVYMTSDGDVNLARKEAGKAVTSTWRRTDVNGTPQLLKYAPQMETPFLREDIAGALKEMGYEGDPSKVRLALTDKTEATRGYKWGFVPVDEDGNVGARLIDPKRKQWAEYNLPDPKKLDAAEVAYRERMKRKTQADFDEKDANRKAVEAFIRERQQGLEP